MNIEEQQFCDNIMKLLELHVKFQSDVTRELGMPDGSFRADIIDRIRGLNSETPSVLETNFTQVHFQTALDMSAIEEAAYRTDSQDVDLDGIVRRLTNPKMVRALHCILGLITEAGEAADILKRHLYYDAPFDDVHFGEELGDITWYQRIGARAIDTLLLQLLLGNVRKLRARYPGKFESDKALNRDLDGERQALEGGKTA